jgi:hypothetical protein
MALNTPNQGENFTRDMCAEALPLAEEAQKCFFSAAEDARPLPEKEMLSKKGIELLNQK